MKKTFVEAHIERICIEDTKDVVTTSVDFPIEDFDIQGQNEVIEEL